MASLPARPLAHLHVSILGRGRVGTALATALTDAGARVGLLPGSSTEAAGDVVFLAVPDDALGSKVEAFHAKPGQIIAHTSGRHGLAILAPVREQGGVALAFHPAMPFAADKRPDLAGASIGLTGDADALAVAETLVSALGARPVWIAEEQRDLYHAGVVHGANHLVTLLAQAQEILAAAGVGDPSAVLRPLVQAALDGALDRGAAATTGPVVRGDIGTIRAHVAAIGADAPGALESYAVLAASTARLAAADRRLDAGTAEQIEHVVDQKVAS